MTELSDTVANIPDDELLRRAVMNVQYPHLTRWRNVMKTFGLGSTYAAQLCRRFGLDPDEELTR